MRDFIFISNGTDDQGSVLVKKFLSLGYNVATFGSSIYKVETLIKETLQYGRKIFIKCVDITDFRELSIFYNEAKLVYGKPLALINNSDSLLSVGQMYLTSMVARDMPSIIVNISSNPIEGLACNAFMSSISEKYNVKMCFINSDTNTCTVDIHMPAPYYRYNREMNLSRFDVANMVVLMCTYAGRSSL